MNLCAPPSTHKRKEQKRKASDRLNQPPMKVHTKSWVDLLSSSSEEVENAKKSNGRTDGRRTTRHDITSPELKIQIQIKKKKNKKKKK